MIYIILCLLNNFTEDIMELPASQDRIFELKNLVAYPGNEFLDQVFYFPKSKEMKHVRIWLGTAAKNPEVEIDNLRFQTKENHAGNWRWIDFGKVKISELSLLGFAIIRYYGLSIKEARESFLVITAQVDKELSGGIKDVEKQLWGITREDAGITTITPSVITAGEPTVFTMTYKAGKAGLPSGAILKLFSHLAFAEPQWDDPGADGAVKIMKSDKKIEFVMVRKSVDSHEKTEIICRLPEGFAPGDELTVSYRSDYTYLHASNFADVDLLYWYMHYPPLRTMVAVGEDKPFVPLLAENSHKVEYIPGPAERLFLFLPGRRFSSEKLKLNGLVTDRFRNLISRVEPLRIKLELTGNIDLELPFTGSFADKSTFSVELPKLEPGIYRARAIDSESGKALAVSNPLEIVPEDSEKPQIYWGEIHGHCEMSDGSGDFAEMYRMARDCFSFDFAASGDHACYFSDNEWEWMQDVTNSFNDPGKFCTLVGYEWAGKQGHRNIYTSRGRMPRYRGMLDETHHLDVVYPQMIDDEELVAGPHTRHTGDFWKHHQPEVERFIELCSMWGQFEDLVKDLLVEGAVIGFTGGGDCHEGRVGFSVEDPGRQGRASHTFAKDLTHKCGITGAVMPGLSRKEMIKALRERSIYATTGARILLDFSVSGIPMGGQGKADATVINATIHACSKIDDVQLVHNGELVKSFPGTGMDMEITWKHEDANPGKHWYYLKVIQDDGEHAWASPVWITL